MSVAALPEFDYTFSTKYVGRADGTVTITDTDTLFTGSNYRLYWGDDNGKLAGYDALATLNDFDVNETGDVLTYTTITHSLIPETATKLYLAVDGNLITEFTFDSWRILSGGELKYVSAHVSDTHVGYNRSEESLTKVLQKMNEIGGVFITNSGDIADRGNDGNFSTYKSIHDSTYPDIPMWATFGITIQVGSGTAYNSSITVKGSADWQPVVLKSSSFTNVNNIYTYASNASTRDTYFVMDVKEGTFTAGQEIVIGNRLEFFSHKAYDKGDANKDGNVDIMDLVKADNQLQNSATEFIPADIDNNGKLNSTDIGYIRKWLFDRKWN